MTTATYQTAGDLFDGWRDDVLTGSAPVLFPIGVGDMARIEIGPGLVTLLGGPPGAGKSELASQWVFDGMRLTPTLRALVCSVEMPPALLLDRQLARLSGIDLTTIRYRRFDAAHADRVDQAMNTLEPLGDRLAFVRPPFDLANVAESADAFGNCGGCLPIARLSGSATSTATAWSNGLPPRRPRTGALRLAGSWQTPSCESPAPTNGPIAGENDVR